MLSQFDFGLYHFHRSPSSTLYETDLPEDMLIPHRLTNENNSGGKYLYQQLMGRHPQLRL
jgi:hypothetical protein